MTVASYMDAEDQLLLHSFFISLIVSVVPLLVTQYKKHQSFISIRFSFYQPQIGSQTYHQMSLFDDMLVKLANLWLVEREPDRYEY